MLTLLVKEVIYMNKIKSTAMLIAIMAAFTFYLAAPVLTTQALSSGIYVNPSTLTAPGQFTIITLVTPIHATGTLNVTCVASGNNWTTNINTVSPTFTQTWNFSKDFPGANTNTLGMYNVTAKLTMLVGRYTWNTSFIVQFFVYPELPLGTILALGACFGGLASYKKLKK